MDEWCTGSVTTGAAIEDLLTHGTAGRMGHALQVSSTVNSPVEFPENDCPIRPICPNRDTGPLSDELADLVVALLPRRPQSQMDPGNFCPVSTDFSLRARAKRAPLSGSGGGRRASGAGGCMNGMAPIGFF